MQNDESISVDMPQCQMTLPLVKSVNVIARVYLDTQYTDMKNPKLLSFGISSINRGFLYVKLSTGWKTAECSGFVVSQVLPILNQEAIFGISENSASDSLVTWLKDVFDDAIRIKGIRPKKNSNIKLGLEIISMHTVDRDLIFKLPRLIENLEILNFEVSHRTLTSLKDDGLDAISVFDEIENFFNVDPQIPRYHALNGALALAYGIRKTEMKSSNVSNGIIEDSDQ